MVLTAAEVAQLTNEQLEEIALTWVNDIRTEYGEPRLDGLPRGLRCNPSGCVMAKALSAALCDGTTQVPHQARHGGSAAIRFGRDNKVQSRPIPADVEQFMHRFDRGDYPQLVLPTTPAKVTVAGLPTT